MNAARELSGEIDVLVVGYGPVGAALAGLLGRYGVTAMVVDKAEEIHMAPRAIALDNEALRILQTVGIADDAFAKVAIPYAKMHSPRLGQFGSVNTAGSIDCHPKLVTFYQPELERALRENVENQQTITVATGVEMTDITDDDDAVIVSLRTADGEESAIRARYVVGADGARSDVRSLLDLDFDGETYAQDWLIVDAVGVPNNIDHVEFICDPDRPTAHMVAPAERTRWEFMLKPGETRAEMEADDTIAKLLAPWAEPEAIRIERKAVYRFHARACHQFGKGRVFLAGDAAHVTPPFVGQGLVAGLRDAVNLAWKLAWVLHGRASASILETYDEERRPHAVKMIALAKRMGQLVMPRNRGTAFMVHGAVALLRRLPFGRFLIDELGMKPQNAYREGLFLPGGRRGLRGAWFPQALVRSEAGTVMPSDEVFGPHIALAGLGVDPRIYLSEAAQNRWELAGGRTVLIESRGVSGAAEDLEGKLVPDAAPHGWCVVVRPDRTVLHDGPIAHAETVVQESLNLLGNPAA